MNFVLLVFAVVLILIPGVIVFIFKLIFHKNRSIYVHKVALGVDRLGAVILYNKWGWTVSSLTYYRYMNRESKRNKKGVYYYFMKMINGLFFDKVHCENSYKWELNHRKKNTSNTTLAVYQ